jgi:UDP-N-acetylglucosamine pyrophosphorylase
MYSNLSPDIHVLGLSSRTALLARPRLRLVSHTFSNLNRTPFSIPVMTLTYEVIKSRFDAEGQGHVFKYYDALSSTEQQRFLAQLDRIDVERLNVITSTALAAQAKDAASQRAGTSAVLEPLPASCFSTAIDNSIQAQEWWKEGIDAISRGEIAVILMAGGQGTRLGTTEPKGCFDIGLPSGKSLFQYQAERIRRLQELAGATIRWYIMTSGPTRKATEEFFENGGPKKQPGTPYFGLEKDNIVFFEQGVYSPEWWRYRPLIMRKQVHYQLSQRMGRSFSKAQEKSQKHQMATVASMPRSPKSNCLLVSPSWKISPRIRLSTSTLTASITASSG